MLCELLVVWLLRALPAEENLQPGPMGVGEDEQHVSRRYAESTIASQVSKIMDSMLQRSFVDFLLSRREKRNKPAATEEEDPELYNELLRIRLQQKQRRQI